MISPDNFSLDLSSFNSDQQQLVIDCNQECQIGETITIELQYNSENFILFRLK